MLLDQYVLDKLSIILQKDLKGKKTASVATRYLSIRKLHTRHLLVVVFYSVDHAPLEYIALHSIVLQCTVYTQVSNGTIDDPRKFFEGLFLRIVLDKIF